MSSSAYHPSTHLHRVNLHPHGKRPFEECGGYDSDPTSMPIQPTASGTSSSSSTTRFQTTASPHNPDARNKRARSTSSSGLDDSSSNPSSSSGYNTAQSSSRSDIFSDGPSLLPTNASDCPIRTVASPPAFVASQDVHMSDLHLPIPQSQPHLPASSAQEDTLRTSLQRFADFDRQIAALRTSLAATRPSPLPSLDPSVDGDPIPSSSHWHPGSSNFLSNASSSLPPSTTSDPAPSTVAVAPIETLNSLSTFASSNGQYATHLDQLSINQRSSLVPPFSDRANIAAAPSTASATDPSASFPPAFSNLLRYPPHPSYHPSLGGSSSLTTYDRVGDAVSSGSTPALIRPSSTENTARLGTRSSVSVDSTHPSTSHTRHVPRSLSPLTFPHNSSSSPSSTLTDDAPLRFRPRHDDANPVNSRSRGRGVDSPVPSLEREVPSRPSHPSEQSGVLQSRLADRVRVIREHSIEREAVPSLFDVFNIGESSQDRNLPTPVRGPTASRYTSIAELVPPRGHGTHTERSRGPAPTTTTVANPVSSQNHPRSHSSWTSIPSSNSLMSESASERRQVLALERFRARLRRSSFDADDESDSRWSASSRGERERENSDRGVASPVPPSPSVESAPGTGTSLHFPSLAALSTTNTNRVEPVTSTSLQRSVSELFAETQRNAREEGAEACLFDWDTPSSAERERLREQDRDRERERARQLDRERQRERVWEWERERERLRERLTQDIRGRNFASGSSVTSTSAAREDLPVPTSSAPPRPSLGQLGAGSSTGTSNANSSTATTHSSQQYSYNNLNLSSFQSGLFRDSLRRNAEVDQASFSTGGPVIPVESRSTSQVGFEDSESEMDLDDIRPPSPEWFRRQPYAGNTPPPDYSPPPRNYSFRPGFTVLRRDNNVNYDPPPLPPLPNRSATVYPRPIPPAHPGQTRTSYENNNQSTPPERTERDRFLPTRILETFYRSHEDGRRNTSSGTGQPYHSHFNQNHALASGPSAVSRHEVLGSRNTNGNGSGNRAGPEAGENRRSSLSLGGSIRSRFARLTNPQSSSGTDMSSSRQRSPPRPIGARPPAAEQRRRASLVFGNTNALEHEARTDARSVSGPPPWASAVEESSMTRDAPWRAPRNSVFVPSAPTSGSSRANTSEVVSRAEEQRSRLRTLRQRLQLDRGSEGMRVFRPGMLRAAMGRRGNFGDYVPDELFDDSYEALLSLSSMLGDVRSRSTPDEVIASLPTGTFKEWKREDSETRCPICLDDYEPLDVVTKLIECTHWLHKNCLEQWLRTANTCPVCREKVKASPKPAPARRRPYPPLSEPTHGAGSSTPGNGVSSRPPHANPQTNNGRPVSFAAMVFDRLMNDGREPHSDSWTSSSAPVPPPTRDMRNIYLERLRAQQQHARQPHEPARTHDMFVELQPPQYHPRVPPASQPRTTSRLTAGAGTSGNDGSGVRPFGFVSVLRGQGSDSSSSSSASMNIDDIGLGSRRSVGSGGPGSGSGSLFLDAPIIPQRESVFPFVLPPAGTFTGAPPTLPPPSQQQQPSFDARPPTMVISNSNESSRDWRGTRPYDALIHVEPSRSSSSSSMSGLQRPMSVANRIPVDEDHEFGFNLFSR